MLAQRGVVGVVVASCLAMAPVASAETFTYGSGVPERSSANSKGVYPLMDKISAVTQNRVTFNKLVGGTVVQINTGLQGVRDSVVDSGFSITQAHPADLPTASLLAEVTGLGTDPYATNGAINEILFTQCPSCLADFKKAGLVVLFVQAATPMNMACTKNVSTSADLKGLRAVAIGAPELRWASKLGMTPARTSFAEVLQSLQLGQSDCFVAPVSWIKSYGLTDVIKSVIEMPQGVVSGALPLFFNQKAWAKISEPDRRAILKLMPRAIYDYVQAAYVDFDADVKKELAGKVKFVPGDKTMNEAWEQYQAGEVQALIDLAERRRLPNARATIETMAGTFKKWHTEYLPKIRGNPDAFAEILWRDVYSKVNP